MLAQLKTSQFSFDTRLLLRPLVVSVGYLLGAEAAFYIGTLSDHFFAPFWPPNVVLFCALTFAPYRQWWIYIAAALPVHVAIEWQVAMPPPQIAVAFATNCAVAILNAFLIKQLLVSPPWLDSFHRAAIYIVVTACFSPAVVAFGGAFVRIIAEGQAHAYWTYWAQWYVANALASLTLGPILLVLLDQSVKRSAWPSRQRLVEALIVAAALVCLCSLAFKARSWTPITGLLPAILYLPLPLVLWSAVRFGVKGASGAILIVTVVSIWMTLSGLTVFGGADSEMNVLAVQLFLTGLAIPVLLLGASIEGMHQAEHTTRELAQTLLWSHDEEKRRTAKELHEGICQELAAASLNAGHMASLLPNNLRSNAEQLERKLQKSIHDLRTASYLLYPPLLDESGLEPALCSYIENFSRQTHIEVDLTVSTQLGRLPSDIEIAVFRLVQDALNDISRRPESLAADICIELCGPSVIVTVAEGGPAREKNLSSLFRRTIPTALAKQSVGLAGMRERLHRIGGKLEYESVGGKTVLKAIIQTCGKPAAESA